MTGEEYRTWTWENQLYTGRPTIPTIMPLRWVKVCQQCYGAGRYHSGAKCESCKGKGK